MDWRNLLHDTPFITRLLSTVVLIVITLGIRGIIVRNLARQEELDANIRRRWIVTVRNATILMVVAIVVVIWLEQLRAVAATIVVVAAAIVVATKEFLLNILGYIYQSSTKFVAIGDRIEMDNIRGDVIDQGLLGLTLMEIGSGEKTHQYTGLTVHVPNSKYLTATIKNETRMWGNYVFHLITIPVSRNETWDTAEQALLRAGEESCKPYLETARHYMTSMARHQSLEPPTVEPRVHVQVAAPDRLNLVLRIPVPTRQRGRLEREVTHRYLKISEELKALAGKASEERKVVADRMEKTEKDGQDIKDAL